MGGDHLSTLIWQFGIYKHKKCDLQYFMILQLGALDV